MSLQKVSNLIVVVVCICCFIPFPQVHGEQVTITEVGSSGTPIAELIERIHAVSTLEFKNAMGYYIVRDFTFKDTQKSTKETEDLKRVLEEGFKKRAAAEKHLGEKHLENLRAENAEALAGATKLYERDTYTFVTRYVIEGDKFRIERTPVSNAESLEKIRQDVIAGQIDLSHPNVIAWNSNLTAEIVSSLSVVRSMDKESDTDSRRSAIHYEKIAKNPEFMDFSRDMKDADFFAPFVKMGLPTNTAAVTINGERAELLRIGDKKSVTFSLETCVLPSKGYVITLSRVRSRGMIMVEDYYSDFVKINDGSWLPTRITRSNYGINSQGVPFIKTKKELLAIEPPKVNVELPKDTFDLANTKEFQSLTPLFRSPKTESEEFVVTADNNRSFLIWWFLLQTSLTLIIIWLWLKFRRK